MLSTSPLDTNRWLPVILTLTLLGGAWTLRRVAAGEVFIPKPAGADGVKPVPPKINDEELQRKVVAPCLKFPWIGKPLATPSKPKPVIDPAAAPGTPGSPPADNAMAMSGDMVIKALGPFTREEKKSVPSLDVADKEVMTMTRNVEIEVIETQSVLRGEHVVIIKDIKSQETELIEAKGGVQLVSPERTGKGEMMRFEMQKGPNGEIIKNKFTLIGDPATGKKATLWLRKDPADPTKTDIIEATRFVRDERLDIFQATGSPNAIVTMADDTAPVADKKGAGAAGQSKPGMELGAPSTEKRPAKSASAKPAAADGSGGGSGGMAGISMSGGGKVNMRCDSEMYFDGPTGRLKLTRNVVFIKEGANPGEGMKMCADDAVVTLDVPPPGTPPNAGNALGGDMKMIESSGRVEIKSGISTILCDKMRMDAERNVAYFEMNNKSDNIYVYNQSQPGGGEIMIVPKTLKMNLDTSELEPGGPMKTRSFSGPPGSNRGNGPLPEDVKPLIDPKAKPLVPDPKAKPVAGGLPNDPKKPAAK